MIATTIKTTERKMIEPRPRATSIAMNLLPSLRILTASGECQRMSQERTGNLRKAPLIPLIRPANTLSRHGAPGTSDGVWQFGTILAFQATGVLQSA
jgi:hypothetical protein